MKSYLIFLIPSMVVQLVLLFLVIRDRSISRNLQFKNVRVVSDTVRTAFIFLCVLSALDIVVSAVQLGLYDELLEYDSAVGWVVVSSVKYALYCVQVASLAGILCNSDFSENGFDFLREVAVVEMKAGTTEGAVMKKPDSSSSSSAKKSGANSSKCEAVEVNVMISKEMTWFVNPPKNFWQIFQFPNPVNENDSRIHSCFSIAYILVILISDHWIGHLKPWYLFVPLFYGYTARVAAGPNLDPHAWLVVYVLSPLVSRWFPPEYVPGPPKRFANFCGMSVSGLAFLLYLLDQKEVSFYILSMLLVLASLQTAGMCLGCFMFHILMLAKMIPEDTCEICKVKFKTVEA
eukprot:CAMPEP_0168564500 /NCGR_PEP_ID=MMETSP0413-20121227/13285_1 /TAXON_ID=136452 /ORGANISM="Filamoeba nolandi, Strain NC-AS-23-1" /LENGTH=346 /DNA_ID=CAMNT_0008596189 /DNA_START=473 /DNA_END=1509 /DNA_ORIENTATION=-